MLFGMLVSLYTSRLVLNALGVEDYGIYNVVGGFVAMFSLISSSLSSSISRFLTFELGKGDTKKLKEVFSTSLLIQLALSVIIIIVAETIGLWFVNYKLVIPADRIVAANWVFQASIFAFILGLLSCPYNATLVSHEKMNIFAYIGILDIFLRLGVVLFIAFSSLHFDKLIAYSLMLVGVGTLLQIIYLSYCGKHFEECRVKPAFFKNCWKEMGGFAGWNTIGCTAGLLKDQGVNILLNLFFGPVVNAARGIASTVSSAIGSFANNFMTAVNPQITKSYAANDTAYTFSLVERGSRFGYYIMMMLALPIILDAPFILTLWLKQYPENTVLFVRLVLVYSLLEVLSNTLINLQVATGKIRNYQLAVGGLLLINFPLSYLCLKLGAEPYSVYIVAIGVGIGCLLLRLLFLQKMVGLNLMQYLRNVVANVVLTNIFAAAIPVMIYLNMPPGILRLIVIALASILCGSISILFIGCTANERNFIVGKVVSIKARLIRQPS